ncbi:lipoate--protein ligase family protein [Haematomicrobium sanguinis]|uniref:lipoate--protein ligase family protein n=1 Tax=Haematomicrobium sanguinis TaxID=479106 RepID=UPI00068C924E|nr:lipoate--protein ligase family protein [Haematomicrobium sanguinis]
MRRQRPRRESTLGWALQSRSLGAAEDLDYALTLLRAVQSGDLGAMVRIYRPEPTVSFGQRDARLPGFAHASRRSAELGFTPVIRKAGGRAAAYHRGSLVVDHLEPNDDAKIETQARFVGFANLFVEALESIGVSAGVGEIPGEYCPGEFSVHGKTMSGTKIKLIGTAQRVVKGAWLFSSSIVVENTPPIREVTEAVYDALGLDLDPATIGSAQDLNALVTTEMVSRAIEGAYRRRTSLEPIEFEQLLTRVPPHAHIPDTKIGLF